jgi:hypothetical protein
MLLKHGYIALIGKDRKKIPSPAFRLNGAAKT